MEARTNLVLLFYAVLLELVVLWKNRNTNCLQNKKRSRLPRSFVTLYLESALNPSMES